MSQNKTLIAYESKGGATAESARKIADVLRSKYNLEVDLVDLAAQKLPDCAQYQNIVVGGGVRAGKIYGKTLKCLENDFGGKNVAFFVCSGEGGEPGKHDSAKAKFAEATLAKYPNVNAVSVEAFGGRMKILGKSVFDSLDLTKVEAWADLLGKKFTQ
jgi:menaquinone-dependent protoporphyrinogen IX oxidase